MPSVERLPIADCQFCQCRGRVVTNWQLAISTCPGTSVERLPIANCRLPICVCRGRIVTNRQLAIGNWQLTHLLLLRIQTPLFFLLSNGRPGARHWQSLVASGPCV